MINQPPNTAFLELAPVPPWNMKTRHAEVYSTRGSLRVFGQFAWLEVGSGKMALSRAAHQRATQAVGWLWQDWNLVYFYLDKKGVMQQELAENIGMSVVAIAYTETGTRWAKLSTLNKIANSLQVSVAGLYKGI